MYYKIITSLFILPGLMATAVAQVKPDTTIIPVGLKKNAQSLSYPVHNGYQTQFSRHVTTAIGTVQGESIVNLVVPNVKAALQGKVAGLYTVQANGMPGGEVAVRLRGTSSIYSETDPLYIIDGVPIYSGPRDYASGGIGGSWGSTFNPLNDINPMDIQTIDVLKDAAATAIYGARGANGVIVITTKAAVVNKPEVRVDYYNGITGITNRRNVLDGPGYLQALDQSWRNSGNTGEGPLPAIAGLNRTLAAATNTDNLSELLQHGRVQQLSVSSSYATPRSSFYFSGGMRNEKGVLTGNDCTRYSAKVKMNNQLTKKLSIGANFGINFTNYYNMPTGYSVGGGFNAAQLNLPVLPYYNAEGNYFYASDPAIYNLPGTNVKSFLNKNDFENDEHTRRIAIAANLGYQFMPV
jgi:TonB-dependent starch-binding outer membrane protein SusC